MRPPPTSLPPAIPEMTHFETRAYRLITPLFGGGVEVGKPDERQAINGKTIRGQLRFWWRATRAAQFKTIKEMKEFEDYLWGCAATDRRRDDTKDTRLAQSRVQVIVTTCTPEKAHTAFNGVNPNDGIAGYAAFPLQENKRQNKPVGTVLKKGTTFTLQLILANHSVQGQALEKEVQAALWAWETFGGVGARTRRGFGAIERTDHTVTDWAQHIKDGLCAHVVTGVAPAGVAVLSTKYILIPVSWQVLIERFRRFRQGKGFARNPGTQQNKPGRSRWPEPDAIRHFKKVSAQAHKNPILKPRIDKFPRGQLGLPIIFHFKDQGEPSDTTLQPKGYERLASPLILRPLSEHCSVAMILETTGKPTQYELSGVNADLTLTPAEAAQIKPLNGQTNVLQAALEHLTKEQP